MIAAIKVCRGFVIEPIRNLPVGAAKILGGVCNDKVRIDKMSTVKVIDHCNEDHYNELVMNPVS